MTAVKRPNSVYNCSSQSRESWEKRAEAALDLWRQSKRISADGVYRIVDLGCGNERLRKILEQGFKESFVYQGYDKFPQTSLAIRMDIEKMFPWGDFDVVFCLGLLEYIKAIPFLCECIAHVARQAVVSYAVSDSRVYTPDEVKYKGWLSHHSSSEMESIFLPYWDVHSRIAVDGGRTFLWLLESRFKSPS